MIARGDNISYILLKSTENEHGRHEVLSQGLTGHTVDQNQGRNPDKLEMTEWPSAPVPHRNA